MSDQPKDQKPKKRAVRIRETLEARPQEPSSPAGGREPGMDPAATAALALAVNSARKAAAPASQSRFSRRQAAYAAALLLALTGAWFGGQAVSSPASHADQRWAEASAALRQGQDDVIRLTGDVKALRVAVEALKEGVERSRADTASKQAQLIERLDRTGRGSQEASAGIDALKAQLDRIEAAAKDPAAKLATLGERLDRIERQAAAKPAAIAAAPAAAAPAPNAAPAPPPAPVEPVSQTGSLEPKKDVTVDGWVLHEVYDGVALIESRNRRLVEVGPGEMVPGVGRVESIERRGKRWVVVTAKGIISAVH